MSSKLKPISNDFLNTCLKKKYFGAFFEQTGKEQIWSSKQQKNTHFPHTFFAFSLDLTLIVHMWR
jgi:hypothetical protein